MFPNLVDRLEAGSGVLHSAGDLEVPLLADPSDRFDSGVAIAAQPGPFHPSPPLQSSILRSPPSALLLIAEHHADLWPRLRHRRPSHHRNQATPDQKKPNPSTRSQSPRDRLASRQSVFLHGGPSAYVFFSHRPEMSRQQLQQDRDIEAPPPSSVRAAPIRHTTPTTEHLHQQQERKGGTGPLNRIHTAATPRQSHKHHPRWAFYEACCVSIGHPFTSFCTPDDS